MALQKKRTTASITIPPEIITEILYHLPAKSVGRFRCLSKDWLRELSSPQFAKTHQNTLNRNHLIFISYDDLSLNSLSLDHHEKIPTKLHPNLCFYTVHGSCNGLVLVSSRDKDGIYQLLVLNPTTREFIELPGSSKYELLNHIPKSHIMYGFGYDSLTDDYKIVTISYNYLPPPSGTTWYFHVCSLRNNSTWTRVNSSPNGYSCIKDSTGVFVNGFLHWFATKRSDGLWVILAFRLANEKLTELPSPNSDIVAKDGCNLVVLGGKLAIFFEYGGEVWLMNEYGVKESWTKIILHGLYKFPTLLRPMIFYNNRIGKFHIVSNNQMLIYDIEEGRFSKNVEISHKRLITQGRYVESLVSPKLTRIS